MYEHILGLTQNPFSFSPDSAFYVPVAEQEKARRQLTSGLNSNRGITLLTGSVGSGKTLLAQKVVDTMRETTIPLFLPSSCFSTRRAFFQSILFELRQPYAGVGEQELRLQLTSLARQMSPRHRPFLLVIDEAHLLTDRILEEIRNSLNLVVEGESVFRILLVGNPELEERLAQPGLAHVNSRIGSHAMIGTLSRQESVEYLQSRINMVNGNAADLIDAEAMLCIAEASDGSPRALNQLADHALTLAAEENALPVTTSLVMEALEELQHLPTHWNTPTLNTETTSDLQEVTGTVEESAETFTSFDWDEQESDCAILEVGSDWDQEPIESELDEVLEESAIEAEEGYLIDMELDARLNKACCPDGICNHSCRKKVDIDEIADPDYSAVSDSDEPVLQEIQAEVTLLNDVLNVQLKQEEETPVETGIQTASLETLATLDLSSFREQQTESTEANPIAGATEEESADGMQSEAVYDRYALIDAGKGEQLIDSPFSEKEPPMTEEFASTEDTEIDSDVFQLRLDELESTHRPTTLAEDVDNDWQSKPRTA